MWRRTVPSCAVAMSESLRCRALFLVVPDRAKIFQNFREEPSRTGAWVARPKSSKGVEMVRSTPFEDLGRATLTAIHAWGSVLGKAAETTPDLPTPIHTHPDGKGATQRARAFLTHCSRRA